MKGNTLNRVLLTVLPMIFLGFGHLTGQGGSADIEAQAAHFGTPLPQGYFDYIRANPGVFEFPASGWSQRTLEAGSNADRFEGRINVLVVPALFSDTAEPFVTSNQLQMRLFDGPSDEGTATDFYLENSGGALTVTGLVTPWVRTSIPLAEGVGDTNGLGGGNRLGEFMLESLALIDGTVDFRQFDSDGPDGIPNSGDDDGVVDVISFEFLEITGSCGGPGVWPHRSSLTGKVGRRYQSGDLGIDGTPIEANGYIIQGATDCDGTTIQSANVISHELGHVFGLPDLYHPIGGSGNSIDRRWIIGCWGLMAAGTWGCGDPREKAVGFGPIHMSPWSKTVLGWHEYIDVGEVLEQEFILDPSQTSGQSLRINLAPNANEFLVLEYRPQIGFDHDLPSSGVLAYHEVPSPVGRTRPGPGQPYILTLLEADGRTDLQRNFGEGGNRGEASDAFGWDGSVSRLSNLTTPNLRLFDGSPSTVTVHEIAIVNDQARIRLTTRPTPTVTNIPTQPQTGNAFDSFEIRYDVVGGAAPYSYQIIDGALPKGLNVIPTEGQLVISGQLLEGGTFAPRFDIVDARGTAAGESIPLFFEIDAISVETDRIIGTLLSNGSSPLSTGEAAFVDVHGNDNGQLDIGDLRAELRRNR